MALSAPSAKSTTGPAVLFGRKVLTGDLMGVSGDDLTIDVRGHKAMTIGFAAIADAKLTITDKLLAATAPLSSEGAEDFEDEPAESAEAEELN